MCLEAISYEPVLGRKGLQMTEFHHVLTIEASRGTPKSLFCLFPPAHCPISLPLGSPTCTGAQALGPCSNVFPRQIIRELNQKWSWVSNSCPFGMPGPETAALPTMPQAGPRFLKKKKITRYNQPSCNTNFFLLWQEI